jgi:hypothetical protein
MVRCDDFLRNGKSTEIFVRITQELQNRLKNSKIKS